MTPKEIAEKIENGIAGIPRWRTFWDFKVGDLADFVADYKRQSELLEEARKVLEPFSLFSDERHWADEMTAARSLLAKLETT